MTPVIPNTVKALGDPMQIAFVTADIEATAAFWIETMGVGPFYAMRDARATMDFFAYRAQPCVAEITVMVAYWGEIQVELIQQHNDVPSVYREGPGPDKGLHHICIIVDEIDAAVERCVSAGGELVQAGASGQNRFVYMDMHGAAGTIVEMLAPTPEIRAYQAQMKAIARDWDGNRPIRAFGE
jgi:catechol 2,3-dioxygenase-like lactoylglutathione lyase family enzyme